MRFEYIKTEYNYIVKGILLKEDGAPERACLIILYNVTSNLEVARKSTNNKGEYEFNYLLNALSPAQYEVRFYGAGSWAQNVYQFEITSSSAAPSVSLSAIPGTVFKMTTAGLVPGAVIINANISGIENPQFAWQMNGELLPYTVAQITPDIVTTFAENDSISIMCSVSGTNKEGIVIEIQTDYIYLNKILDSYMVVYRGLYDAAKTYYKTAVRRDVVYKTDRYYICKTNETTGTWDVSKWEEFGSTFSSVATELLLAEDAVITKTLTLGEEGSDNYGVLRSANAVDADNGNGFWLRANQTNSEFRIGSESQFLKWDGISLRVKSDHFDLTTDGKLWAGQGGFGGSIASPKIELTSAGLKTGETYLHGNNVWTAPTNVRLNPEDSGTTFNLINVGSVMNKVFEIVETDLKKTFSITFHVEGAGGRSTDIHKGYVYIYFTPTGGTETLAVASSFNVSNGVTTSKSVNYYADAVGRLRIQIAYSACDSSRPVLVLD